MTRARRVLRRLALGLVAVVVVALAAVAVLHARLPTDDVPALDAGTLTVTAILGTFAVGDSELTVTADTLRITRNGHVVWSSDPEGAFVTAADGRVDVAEYRGDFWPTVHRDRVWSDQTVDSVTNSARGATIAGRLVSGERTKPYEVQLSEAAGRVTMTVSVPGSSSVSLLSGRSTHAGVHGLGEPFTDFDLDGRVLPLLGREQGVGRGEQPLTFLADLTNHGAGGTQAMTYAAWPSLVTDDLRGVRVAPNSTGAQAFAVADLSAPTRIGLELWQPSLTVELTSAGTPAELVTAQQTGTRRASLARWTQEGLIAGLQGGTDVVRQRVARLRAAGVHLAGVWLQDWVGQRTTSFGDRLWWTWQLDRSRYPDWEGLVRDLNAAGIRVTTYVNPFVVDSAPKGDKRIRSSYAEARAAGHLVRDAHGQPYALDQGGFTAYLVDLTNPAARDWFANVIAQDVLGIGVDGFMADFGEGLPYDAVLHSGAARDLHNAWPTLWADTVADACRRAGKPDCVTWFRSGSLGTSPALAWNGDQLVDFGREDGLASALLGTFSAGVSGWPVVHSDIGGYTSINAVVKDYRRTPELLERWAEVAAFGPVMRTHETNRPSANLQSDGDSAVARHLARMTAVFAALKDYRAIVLDEAVRTGLPVIRHGWLVAPGTAAAKVDTQFFLGNDVLVAPVLTEGATTVSVTFPPGRWRNLFTGDVVEGGQTSTVAAPIGQPAAYIATSSVWADRLVPLVKP